MKLCIRSACLGAAAGLAFAAGAAHAQQQNLTEQDVRQFFDRMENDVTETVRAEEYDRLLDWTRDTVAEGATFFVTEEVYAGDERKSFLTVSLNKEDMLRLGGVAVGALGGMDGKSLEDYSLEIETTEVKPIGPNAATAKTRMTEIATMKLPDEDMQPSRVDSDRAAGTIQIKTTASCSHLIQRGKTDGDLVLGMTACEARTKL